ncbi:RGG repeats nuclear RNA binding protein B [Drosophila eugracilis]|uniref:RGG repeats nuclear RNA binding protein B n=1 Tax=Drosophila eugracilis TaxID=29029 RepID=UPI0007E7C627|nr:RGG repeats nuclear RNA binding protein B [Drosophila eugracilis]
MKSCCGAIEILHLGQAQERKMIRKPSLMKFLKNTPPKPQKETRLFLPKGQSKTVLINPLKANNKDKDLKGNLIVTDSKRLEKESLRKSGRNHRGARLFDRHSGSYRTGVKAMDKRNGAGAHNWGSLEYNDIEEDDSTNYKSKKLTKDVYCQSEFENIEEPKQYTLDEYRAIQKRNALEKNSELDSKNDKVSLELGELGVIGQRSSRKLRLTDFNFNFNTEQEPNFEINKEPKFCPKVDDDEQFPSLV